MQKRSTEKDSDIYHLSEYLDKFNIYLKKNVLSVAEKQDMIFQGRKLSNLYLDYYKKTSNIPILFSILEIFEIISSNYPKVIGEEVISKNELHLINDKCKYFIHLILVLFHLNDMRRVDYELTAFKSHLQTFKKQICKDFKTMYYRIMELFDSFVYVSVYKERGIRVNIYNSLGFQEYESYNFSDNEGNKLNRAVIINSCSTQISLTKITVDMFRISQALESKYKKDSYINSTPKVMLYNTNFWDVEIAINDAQHNMPRSNIFLLYVNGDAYEKKDSLQIKTQNTLYKFGIKMKQEVDENIEHSKIECLYPGDVATFLVVPTLLIIDSECSPSFKELYRHTDESFMCLLSPAIYPRFIETSNSGKLFTLFLTSPQTAFCWVCHKRTVDSSLWEDIIQYMNKFMLLSLEIVNKCIRRIRCDKLITFMEDKFSRAALLRYMFCVVTLRLHSEFINEDYYPKSNFSILESEILSNRQLQSLVYAMASIMDSNVYFINSDDLSVANESIDVEK